MATIVVVGASGTMGRLIALEAVRRELDVVLAGRAGERLADVARTLPSGRARVAVVDVGDAAAVGAVVGPGDVVVNTVGPFSRFAEPVVEACLRSGTAYVDLANELAAVRAVLERDADARERGVQLVTGAGFGVVATETLALILKHASPERLESVYVAAAQAVAYATRGVQATIQDSLAQGSPRYVDGQLVAGALGEGATTIQLPDGQREMMPVASGDLIAAQRATGAPNVVAYAAVRGERGEPATEAKEMRSVAVARGRTARGAEIEADITFGEGFAASAAIAVEVAVRTIGQARPGAWTPGQLFGTELALACGGVVRLAAA
jgi:saccharopine dehydrogenase (NAD+, L-lysine-forming)